MVNKSRYFLRLVGFSEEANHAVNNAIYFSESEECEWVNSVHLFLALVERTKIGEAMLNDLGTTFDMIYSSYQNLAISGAYGKSSKLMDDVFGSDNPEDGLKRITPDLSAIILELTHSAYLSRQSVSSEKIMRKLLENESEELAIFLEYIGTSVEQINNIFSEDLEIPEELDAFIKDMNVDPKIFKNTYVNTKEYTDEIVEVLCRKKKPNPCLIGEPGVGKTALVEAFVQRIVNSDVPDCLKGVHVCEINGSLITAGTRYRGDFEARMKMIIDWASENGVILFLDELHSFIDAGSGSNSGESAGNMIKTYINDGSVKVIGATTLAEYRKFVEKDSALQRRLQSIVVKEPSLEESVVMAKLVKRDYESFHNVHMDDELITLSAKLADRYMKSSNFPDKLLTVMDQSYTFARISKRLDVDESDVRRTVSKITGIDASKLSDESRKSLIKLEEIIEKDLIGQSEAVKKVAQAIRRGKSGVSASSKPIASFLFVGPTGVGKTELCRLLSKEVALGDASFIKIDMSEFADKISVNKFIGSAPGYIGYGEGGQLTEKVKHNPYSIVLFDEIEKAHPDVFNIFLQILEDGKLSDSEGKTIDFTNTIIVMTSNAGYGADGMNKGTLGFGVSEDSEDKASKQERIAMEALQNTFKPEFLNRIDNVVIFNKLSKENCALITKLELDKVAKRLAEQGIKVTFTKSVVDNITDRGYSEKYGARNIKREIQNTVENELADAILVGTLYEGCKATVKCNGGKLSLTVKTTNK